MHVCTVGVLLKISSVVISTECHIMMMPFFKCEISTHNFSNFSWGRQGYTVQCINSGQTNSYCRYYYWSWGWWYYVGSVNGSCSGKATW